MCRSSSVPPCMGWASRARLLARARGTHTPRAGGALSWTPPGTVPSTDTRALGKQSELCSGRKTLTIYIYIFQSTQLETELCPFLRLWNIPAPNTGLYSPLAWASLFLSCSCTPYGSRPWDKFCTDLWPLQPEGLTYSINPGGRAHGQPARSSPHCPCSCALVSASQGWGFTPHTESRSGLRAHQGNPASNETQHDGHYASTPRNSLQ